MEIEEEDEITRAIILEFKELGARRGLTIGKYSPTGKNSTYISDEYWTADFSYAIQFTEAKVDVRTYKRLGRTADDDFERSDKVFEIADPTFTVQKIIDFIESQKCPRMGFYEHQ